MKRATVLLLTMIMVLALAACSGSTTSTTETEEETIEETTAEESGEEEEETADETLIYVYDEDRGDFTVTWTLYLYPAGNYILTELHGLSGNTNTYTGSEWTDNGDGTVTTGAWNEEGDKSDFFEEDGTCVWIVNEDGTCEPANAGTESTSLAGLYVYEEDHGDFIVTWELMLNGNGSVIYNETHGLSGETTTHTASEWTDNGDGTVSCGAWDEDGDKSDFFAEDGSCTWKINVEDGTCEPVETGEEETASIAGKYIYEEDHGDFVVTWELQLWGSGEFVLSETHGLSGEVNTYQGTEWTDNGDGTASIGAWGDDSVNRSDFFEEDGSCTFEVDVENGTWTPIE